MHSGSMILGPVVIITLSVICGKGLACDKADYLPIQCNHTGTLLPNLLDCGAYSQCSNSLSHLKRCPSHLYFSFNKQRCVYPCESECVPPEPSTTPIPPEENECEDEGCTSFNCLNEFDTWPNLNDSTTYYECSLNCACLIHCPSGLVYDTLVGYCKEPNCAVDTNSPACKSIPAHSSVIRNTRFFNEPLCIRNEGKTCSFTIRPSDSCSLHFWVCYEDWTCKFNCDDGYTFVFWKNGGYCEPSDEENLERFQRSACSNSRTSLK